MYNRMLGQSSTLNANPMCLTAPQDHINEEISRLNALEERIMNESGPDDERLQVRHRAAPVMMLHTEEKAQL